jgi:chorismate synthase
MLRFLTAGESHGKALVAIIEGLPANMDLDISIIDRDLKRRMTGYGRGGRMKIESDKVEILSGLFKGKTIGSPLAMMIRNLDYENWKDTDVPVVTRPRPGHGDLAGVIKYRQEDIRGILERASARETAARVAVGAVAKQLLSHLGIRFFSHVIAIGDVKMKAEFRPDDSCDILRVEESPVRCIDEEAERLMIKAIDEAALAGDSLGGVFEAIAINAPVGLGSHAHWDRKLDGRIAQSFMSIQAIKGVEIGLGNRCAHLPGSRVHDEIFFDQSVGSFYRKTNNAGGIEAGISNGCPIVVRAAMKPIPTLYKPLRSVDIKTKQQFSAGIERSDVCAVPAASIVGEAALAWVLAEAASEKFGGDSIEEMLENYNSYAGGESL